jgi:hypothetical protein
MIVGLLGLRGSGKNTVARLMIENARGALATEVALADELKRILYRLYDFTEEQVWGSEKEDPDHRYPREHTWDLTGGDEEDKFQFKCTCCGILKSDRGNFRCYLTPRYAQQILGTEMGRNCYPNTWVDQMLRTAGKLAEGGYSYNRLDGLFKSDGMPSQHTVVTDVRFKNEVAAIMNSGGKVFRVVRTGYEKPAFNHPSETEQMSIPDSDLSGVINNGGSIDMLKAVILPTTFEK